jgi:hypothetical protein
MRVLGGDLVRATALASLPFAYVDQITFDKLYQESVERGFGATQARVVSAMHLAMLKIHALKYYQAHREPKGYSDLIGLLRTGKAVFAEQELRAICERYASRELYDRIEKDLKKMR